MSGSRRIDLYQDDRGLSTCFAGANILEEWKSELVTTHKRETLEDFIYYFDEAAMEKSLDHVLQATKVRENRLVRLVSRRLMQPGWRPSVQLRLMPSSLTRRTKSCQSLPCSSSTRTLPASMALCWMRSWSHLTHSVPAFTGNSARGQCQLSVWPKSALSFTNRHPSNRNQVRLGAGVQLEFAADEHRVVRTVVEYDFSLRTLAYAWAWGGLYKVADFDGNERVFMPLAPGYVVRGSSPTIYNGVRTGQPYLVGTERHQHSLQDGIPHSPRLYRGDLPWGRPYTKPTSIGAPRGSSLPCLRQVCHPRGGSPKVNSQWTRAPPRSDA